MSMPEASLWIAAIAALAIGDIALLWLGYWWGRRRVERPREEVSRQDIQALQLSFATLIKRLERVEDALQRLEGGKPAAAEHQPYEVAARLIRRGAGVEELMSVCGLTQGEAELLLNLHAPSKGDRP